jgi:hypothetical protein
MSTSRYSHRRPGANQGTGNYLFSLKIEGKSIPKSLQEMQPK